MRRRAVPTAAALHSVLSGKRFLNRSTSRAFSNKTIESPSLLSVDIVDSWSSISKLSVQSCTEEWSKNKCTKIIDGRAIADGIRSKVASELSQMKELIGQVPSLAVILVGQRRDSQIYVHNKIIASDEHLDEAKILSFISLEKDVDGFHPLNIGNLAMQGMEPVFIPRTPKGCIELLLQSGVEITGKTAVVIGRSNIVGLPTSLLLQRHHATVTVVNAFTKNPEKIAREAGILSVSCWSGLWQLVKARRCRC